MGIFAAESTVNLGGRFKNLGGLRADVHGNAARIKVKGRRG
ncbi:hypothetical protein [Haladaptatus sp. DYF46]|nr:hypothetical protein [Haladaptatus sp. DYF46]